MTAAARTSLVKLSAAEVDIPEAKNFGQSLEWAALQTGHPHAFSSAELSAPAEVGRREARMVRLLSSFAVPLVSVADDTQRACWAVWDGHTTRIACFLVHDQTLATWARTKKLSGNKTDPAERLIV